MVFKFLIRALFHHSVSQDIENPNIASKQRPRGACIFSRDSSPTIFSKLPAELLLAVLEQLPLHAVANLALTNRWMLCTVNEIAHPFTELRLLRDRFERANFLITFDEHHPDELICYACAKYHPRWILSFTWLGAKWTRKREFICQHQKATYGEAVLLDENAHSWLAFHKVMRAFRYSLRHGEPCLLNLSDLTQWKFWKYDSLAFPVDGHLLLRERWYASLNGIKSSTSGFDRIQLLCPHVRMVGITWRNWRDELVRAKVAIAKLGDNNTYQEAFMFKTYRCSHCPTELRIEVQPRMLFQGRMKVDMECDPYVIAITSYKDFGACKSPDEIEWRSLTTWYRGPQDPRGPYTISFPHFVKNEPTDPSMERPSLNVTHLEPIRTKFERQLYCRSKVSTFPVD